MLIGNFFDNHPHLKEFFIGENGKLSHTLAYKAKVKLHGTYGGINIDFKMNHINPQSRERKLTEEKPDSYGFYNWVMNALGGNEFALNLKSDIENNDNWDFSSLKNNILNIVIHGEWAGPNVYYGVSSGLVKKDFYSVFAIEVFTDHPCGCIVITDPQEIKGLFARSAKQEIKSVGDKVECHNSSFYILPYYKINELATSSEWGKNS